MGIELIKIIPMEIDSLPDEDILEPAQPYKPEEEKVLGEMPLYLRKLYTIMMDSQKQSDKMAVELKYSPSEEERRKLLHGSMKYASKYRTYRYLFWYCLEEDFKVWDINLENYIVAVRKGYLVVLQPNRPQGIQFGPFQIEQGGE